jgi:hypothetical protein
MSAWITKMNFLVCKEKIGDPDQDYRIGLSPF